MECLEPRPFWQLRFSHASQVRSLLLILQVGLGSEGEAVYIHYVCARRARHIPYTSNSMTLLWIDAIVAESASN